MLIPPPTYNQPDQSEVSETRSPYYYQWVFSQPSWYCECKLRNFHFNKVCADRRCQKTRPANVVEAAYEPE